MSNCVAIAGPPGPPGPPGPAGPASTVPGPSGPATIAVGTTTTGAPGSSASVVNAGTSGNTILNFVIPRGEAGPAGATGATGATGPAGATGAASTVPGPAGPAGPAGATGATGAQGIQGIQGPPGFGTVQDEGVALPQQYPVINFIGSGVTAASDVANSRTVITIPGASGGHVIADEGAALIARPTLNFIGTGVTATDDTANNRTNVTISGGAAAIGSMTTAAFNALSGNGGYQLIRLTDDVYTLIWNGTAWDYYYLGSKLTVPNYAGYSWASQGAAVLDTVTTKSSLLSLNDNTLTVRNYGKPVSGNFSIRALINPNLSANSQQWEGLFVSDGTKLLTFSPLYSSGAYRLNITQWNSASSYQTDMVTMNLSSLSAFYLGIREDAANRYFELNSTGLDPDWNIYLVQAKSVWLATARAGIFILNSSGVTCSLRIIHLV